ncbi:SDR family oxidoreductase [Saccharothrix coeruleofusca]|uniref:NmrA family protein n=1 Tax=Saccharothrix coeruleofusca TaxID=33919 RepID=A0A918AHT0_9PSEU|nr:NAD(P)H-binding protein [Saccharothrix coeruleofusca]MBP2340004.1 uncharacterized protein YbjT (DUF2867 family) [Saccharothrix coeruleofusca]GGP38032.1 NmrA family protein [Saccharothrix coeruleofusca]
MSEKPILVLGATGTTGRRVAALLTGAGHEVRAASRAGGARFDWTDRDTWTAALDGVERVYLMAPHELPVDPEFVHAAVRGGVRRLVLLSSRGIEEMRDERLLAAERTVRESGADWTVVRADWFNQNFDEGFFRPAVLAGELVLPVGDTKQGFVDADDIAAVAAAALTEPGHEGRSYELTGPQALSFREALDVIGEVTGREIAFRGESDGTGPWDALTDTTPTDAVTRVTGREPRSFREYAERAAATGAWRR